MSDASRPSHKVTDVWSVVMRVLVEVVTARGPLIVDLVVPTTMRLAWVLGVVALRIGAACSSTTSRCDSSLL